MIKKDFDLLSLGEILLRLSPPNNERIVRGETFQKQVGGAELNVVSGVSLLGLRTGVISKLPDNALGTYAKNRVRFCGVSDDYLVYDQDPDGHYFQINLYFPEQPEGTSFCPEGTYTLSDQNGEYTMFSTGSSYFPGTQVLIARQLFSSGTCTIAKDGDNYVVDLDVVTVDDQLSRHARYTGPVELSIL